MKSSRSFLQGGAVYLKEMSNINIENSKFE